MQFLRLAAKHNVSEDYQHELVKLITNPDFRPWALAKTRYHLKQVHSMMVCELVMSYTLNARYL